MDENTKPTLTTLNFTRLATTKMLPSTAPTKTELVFEAWLNGAQVPTVIDKPDGLQDGDGIIDGWYFDGKVAHFKLRPKD